MQFLKLGNISLPQITRENVLMVFYRRIISSHEKIDIISFTTFYEQKLRLIMDFDEILEAVVVIEDVQDAEEQAAVERQLLQMKDPFSLTDAKFVKYFRLTKELTRQLIEIVTPFMGAPTRRSALSIDRKVFVALKFFGYGAYQEMTGTNCYTAVSQAAVSRAINEVCDALVHPDIFRSWVRFSRNFAECQTLRNRFFIKYGIPGTIGVIDCTHVAIVKPPSNNPLHPEHVYVNRKNFHSLNVQLICDDNLKIINVNAKFPGSCHDSHIWRESRVSEVMERMYRANNENHFFLLGDSGYPLRPWIITPLRNTMPNTPEDQFNNTLKSARSIIERCNGVLKNRFRCLIKQRVLHYSPTMASKIINACIVLHNMCIEHRIPEPEPNDIPEKELGMDIPVDVFIEEPEYLGRVNPDLAAARLL